VSGRVGGRVGVKNKHSKLEETTGGNTTKTSGNLLLTSVIKVSPIGEQISKEESMRQF
jgi:hypothetical protein